MVGDDLKIRVKMCGNCNPCYDPKQLLLEIQSKESGLRYVFSDEEECAAALLLNGCPVSCAVMPDGKGPQITVAGFSVNDEAVQESQLAERLADILRTIKNRKEKP